MCTTRLTSSVLFVGLNATVNVYMDRCYFIVSMFLACLLHNLSAEDYISHCVMIIDCEDLKWPLTIRVAVAIVFRLVITPPLTCFAAVIIGAPALRMINA